MQKFRGSRHSRLTRYHRRNQQPPSIRLIKSFFARSLIAATLLLPALASAGGFVEFESGQVRPLAMSADGQQLYAVNTPDNRLEVFTITAAGLSAVTSVPVGLEPVAVAMRSDTEAWVVNHLSDSISIVDLGSNPARVVRTLLVGDEPRDIVFAGPGRNRAFITTAHRGQNSPVDPQLTTPGIGRADVWVFDASNPGAALGGTPITILSLFTDTPRALAVSADGATVYAAGFQTGNQTTTISEGSVCDGGVLAKPCRPATGEEMAPGGLPAPNQNVAGVAQPETGLIVKFTNGHWLDELSRSWDSQVRFNLPDRDVFAINANAPVPSLTRSFSGVGTVLFNMVVNPISGKLYVSNTEAINQVRFEGNRLPGDSTTTVQGRLHQSRITVIDGAQVLPRHLNKHINYALRPAPAGVAANSLAIPTGMAVSSDGASLYLAAFGSSKIGVFSTAQLENDEFVPNAANQIEVSGGGPSGLLLDEARNRLYVLTRFDDSVVVVDTVARHQIARLAMHNPEPASIVNGRRFLYDATLTSSNGEASCASCHVFGDLDSLAWDLGDPNGAVLANPSVYQGRRIIKPGFHPMKGPMTTQSMRGIANAGPMHWRGDRTGGNDEASVRPDSGVFNERAAFKKFNPAFVSLLGRQSPLSDSEMQALADFSLQLSYPPNPIRALDNSLTPDQAEGRRIYFKELVDTHTCSHCHTLDPSQGFYGADGVSSSSKETQLFKVPQLRSVYQKVGMFGNPLISMMRPGDNGPKGDQIRGFGLTHDGSVDTPFRFVGQRAFTFIPGGLFGNDLPRRQVEQFLFVYDTELAPIVGQQITLTSNNSALVNPRIDLLLARARLSECDLVVKGVLAGEARGWYLGSAGTFISDRAANAPINDHDLRAQAATPGQALTYTCVPPGSGRRIGIDRDDDGVLDGDSH